MQAKRKLTALLLSLCMVLGVLPMTAFAAGAPAAPGDLKREWTNSGLKVSWSQPEPIGELEIFEYEVPSESWRSLSMKCPFSSMRI